MDRIEPSSKNPLSVRRGFSRSRLEGELAAWAYEIVVPEVRKPVLPRQRVLGSNSDKQPAAATGA